MLDWNQLNAVLTKLWVAIWDQFHAFRKPVFKVNYHYYVIGDQMFSEYIYIICAYGPYC